MSKHRAWTAAEKAFALEMLPICGDNLARTIARLVDNHFSVCGPSKGQQPATPLLSRAGRGRWWWWTRDVTGMRVGVSGRRGRLDDDEMG